MPMRFYQHKETGELLAFSGELLNVVTNEKGIHTGCMARVVFPERQIGYGVIFSVMHYSELRFFKRIKRELFFELCPDFGQYRHHSDDSVNFLSKRSLFTLGDYPIRKRKKTFGHLFNPKTGKSENFNSETQKFDSDL
jgi:hypothetical protein